MKGDVYETWRERKGKGDGMEKGRNGLRGEGRERETGDGERKSMHERVRKGRGERGDGEEKDWYERERKGRAET